MEHIARRYISICIYLRNLLQNETHWLSITEHYFSQSLPKFHKHRILLSHSLNLLLILNYILTMIANIKSNKNTTAIVHTQKLHSFHFLSFVIFVSRSFIFTLTQTSRSHALTYPFLHAMPPSHGKSLIPIYLNNVLPKILFRLQEHHFQVREPCILRRIKSVSVVFWADRK